MAIFIHVTADGTIEIGASKSYCKPTEGGVDFMPKYEGEECVEPGLLNHYEPVGSVEEALDMVSSMLKNGETNRPKAAAEEKAAYDAAFLASAGDQGLDESY